MTTSTYLALDHLRKNNPELTFDNDGYEQLDPKITKKHRLEIDEIERLLKSAVTGFVRFQNFKPRKDGSIAVRYQVKYDESFIGVAYTPLEKFKETAE